MTYCRGDTVYYIIGSQIVEIVQLVGQQVLSSVNVGGSV